MSLPKRLTADTANVLGINFQPAPKSRLEHSGSPGELDKLCPAGTKLMRICKGTMCQPFPKNPSHFCSAAEAWTGPGVFARCTQLPWHCAPHAIDTWTHWSKLSEGPGIWLEFGRMKELGHLLCEKRLRELGLLNLKTAKPRQILLICINTWWGWVKKMEPDLFFCFFGFFFAISPFTQVIKHSLPRQVVESLSSETFKAWLDSALSNPL